MPLPCQQHKAPLRRALGQHCQLATALEVAQRHPRRRRTATTAAAHRLHPEGHPAKRHPVERADGEDLATAPEGRQVPARRLCAHDDQPGSAACAAVASVVGAGVATGGGAAGGWATEERAQCRQLHRAALGGRPRRRGGGADSRRRPEGLRPERLPVRSGRLRGRWFIQQRACHGRGGLRLTHQRNAGAPGRRLGQRTGRTLCIVVIVVVVVVWR